MGGGADFYSGKGAKGGYGGRGGYGGWGRQEQNIPSGMKGGKGKGGKYAEEAQGKGKGGKRGAASGSNVPAGTEGNAPSGAPEARDWALLGRPECTAADLAREGADAWEGYVPPGGLCPHCQSAGPFTERPSAQHVPVTYWTSKKLLVAGMVGEDIRIPAFSGQGMNYGNCRLTWVQQGHGTAATALKRKEETPSTPQKNKLRCK